MRVSFAEAGCVASTGTGRSLSLKLIQQLRDEGAKLSKSDAAASSGSGPLARTFREVQLQEPIR